MIFLAQSETTDQEQVIRCQTQTQWARRRSSIFEKTLTPNPSVCRWLLDIISKDEHMVKESPHFVLSENQLIQVICYTFDVPESQKQFNSNITDALFIKSSGDDNVILLGGGGTKPIFEFSRSIDDSNYMKKTGQNLQLIQGYLRKDGEDNEEVSEDNDDYISRGYAESKYVGIQNQQQINGTKSFYDNITVNGFIKKGYTNQPVPLANVSTKPLSEFSSSRSADDSNYVKKTGQETQTFEGNLIISGSEISFANHQPFQQITKQEGYYGFVQKY
ncbi:MAG: hypothetical protein EZS28_019985 [Streblomastix strix]|uniref:Uncharacterized protein n=1 Tax=Streblomastix strix TaxID=222440 RepID=A0A5J4VQ62_9EUKA|nr:MAG: hypothetical protein EZS28_019985 [Streblomastix strix]